MSRAKHPNSGESNCLTKYSEVYRLLTSDVSVFWVWSGMACNKPSGWIRVGVLPCNVYRG